ncbi:hypothetical protein [Marinomonas transparens]|uniref:Uncharacterized protein n=1 Tax=Marinomonas transparens TaxID=2795388 RepID=A0A934JYK3_9GAMM|nr:hypothetical protein [Marinomonas transparens]MBJ7539307.1 hypothetical protein [Marinomonas transparens]
MKAGTSGLFSLVTAQSHDIKAESGCKKVNRQDQQDRKAICHILLLSEKSQMLKQRKRPKPLSMAPKPCGKTTL